MQIQRTQTLRTLQDYTRLKAERRPVADAAWLLVLEAMIFQAEAEVRWLDHCETRIAAAAREAASARDRRPRMSVLELRDVSRIHGTGETAVHALQPRQPERSSRASWSP